MAAACIASGLPRYEALIFVDADEFAEWGDPGAADGGDPGGKAANGDRGTDGVSLRYNPTLQIGSFMIRISDFNWVGSADPFSLEEVKPVVGGVRQD